MKSVGVLSSSACKHHAFGASLAAMLLVLIASTLASAQSGDTTASETWKSAAASAASASSTSAGPTNLVPTRLDNLEKTPRATTEIAPASLDDPQQHPSGAALDSQTAADSQPSNESNDIAKYQAEQSGMPPQQLMQQQFDNDGELSTPFGMQLREAKRTLKSGEDADGLLITTVQKGGPAATAGLHPYNHTVHDALAGAAIAGALIPPFGAPAILLLPVLDMMQVGESYDMIIGVDGSRVTNFLDFQDRMRDLQPGEIIYLSIVRNGKRVQITLPVTADTLQATTN